MLLSSYKNNFELEGLVWFLIWFTLPLSIWLNSLAIVIGVIILLTLFIRKPHSVDARLLIHLLFPALLFVISAASVYNKLLILQTWKELEQMLPLIVIPAMFLLGSINKKSFAQVSFTALLASLVIGGIIMLGESIFRFTYEYDFTVFTYHDLVRPFNSGAIYNSFFILVILLQINEIHWLSKHKIWKYIIIIFFLIILFLSASKLMIGIGVLVLILRYRKDLKSTLLRRKILIPAIVILGLLLIIPTVNRIKQISEPNIDIVFADSYSYDSPLNGLNLRLIQVRLGINILNEKVAWLWGVGIDESQEMLNNQYLKYGIYTGYEGTTDTGYLNYNFHNQFIETLVRSGIIGLIILLAMFFKLLAIPQYNRFISNWVIFIVFMFFLTESVLERQQGIVYFCLIYSSYFLDNLKINNTNEL